MQLLGPHPQNGWEPLVYCVAMSEQVLYVNKTNSGSWPVHKRVISSHRYITAYKLLLFVLLAASLLHSNLVGSQHKYRRH